MADVDSARTVFANLLGCQEAERADLAAKMLEEGRAAANAYRSQFNTEGGAAPVSVLPEIETQIRRDRRADRLLPKVEAVVTDWADIHLPPLDRDDRDAGRRSEVVVVPQVFADEQARVEQLREPRRAEEEAERARS